LFSFTTVTVNEQVRVVSFPRQSRAKHWTVAGAAVVAAEDARELHRDHAHGEDCAGGEENQRGSLADQLQGQRGGDDRQRAGQDAEERSSGFGSWCTSRNADPARG